MIDFHQGPPRTIWQGPRRPLYKWPLLRSARDWTRNVNVSSVSAGAAVTQVPVELSLVRLLHGSGCSRHHKRRVWSFCSLPSPKNTLRLGVFLAPTPAKFRYCQTEQKISNKRFKKGTGSPYSIAERRVPELIPVLGSQPAGDVSHEPRGRLPLLSAGPAVTAATLKRAATNFAAW